MKTIKYYFASLLILLLFNCSRDLSNSDEFKSLIVVEGHIDQGEYPIVYITRNIPYYANIDSADMLNLVLRQAKVVVSDEKQSEVLTLEFDQNHFPPFYYQGTEIRGQVGKSYNLTIIYGKDTLTSTTTIPPIVKPDTAWLQPEKDNPEKCKLFVNIHDDPAITNYYRTFTCIAGVQKDFYPTLVSNFKDALFNGEVNTFELNRGLESYLNLSQRDFLFDIKDTVLLKFCTLDEAHFHYWQSYQSELVNGSNPFASSFHSILSNIHGNGIGIWGGYGVTIMKISFK